MQRYPQPEPEPEPEVRSTAPRRDAISQMSARRNAAARSMGGASPALPAREMPTRTASATRRELINQPGGQWSSALPPPPAARTLSAASPRPSQGRAQPPVSSPGFLPYRAEQARSPSRSRMSSPSRSSTAQQHTDSPTAIRSRSPGQTGFGNELRLRAGRIQDTRRSRSRSRTVESPRRTRSALSPSRSRPSSRGRTSSLASETVTPRAPGGGFRESEYLLQSASRDKLRALISDMNDRSSPERQLTVSRSRLDTSTGARASARPAEPDPDVQLQLGRLRAAEHTVRSAEELATSEEQTVEIERLRAWLSSSKEAEDNERALRLELQQRAFEEVAAATAAVGVAEAEQRRREMETDSRQNAEWRLAVAQEELLAAQQQLERERMKRMRLEEQKVVVVDHRGESHSFYPNQGKVTDSEYSDDDHGYSDY